MMKTEELQTHTKRQQAGAVAGRAIAGLVNGISCYIRDEGNGFKRYGNEVDTEFEPEADTLAEVGMLRADGRELLDIYRELVTDRGRWPQAVDEALRLIVHEHDEFSRICDDLCERGESFVVIQGCRQAS